MKMIKLEPPGSICQNKAIFDVLANKSPQTFLEVGCGSGDLSKKLLARGMTGVGVDFSSRAINLAAEELRDFTETGRYELFEGDVFELPLQENYFDLVISMMVMEHIEDDRNFLSRLFSLVKPGGNLILGVPARPECWCAEDETAGHFRRYDRGELKEFLESVGLHDVLVWSMGVPTSNLLAGLSDFLVRRDSNERSKLSHTMREQTEASGIREIPFKTVFPPVFKLLLNEFTMSPVWLMQRLFYETSLGLTVISCGTK